jgi:hypothetical protein
MKLIIDIPEEMYERTKDGYVPLGISKYLKNGTPLDDVKAEIEKQIESDFAFAKIESLNVPCHYGIANGLQNAIRIIDNAVSNNCKNLSESYGEICVKCNKCGRFDKAESEGE